MLRRQLRDKLATLSLCVSTPQCSCSSLSFPRPPWTPVFLYSTQRDKRYVDFKISKLQELVKQKQYIDEKGLCSLLTQARTIAQINELMQVARKAKCNTLMVYHTYINSLIRNGDISATTKVFREMADAGLEPHIGIFNSLLKSMSGSDSQFNEILDEINQRGLKYNSSTYGFAIRHFAKLGRDAKCVELENQMHENNVQPDVYTYNIILNLYSRRRDLEKCKQLLTQMREHNVTPTVVSYTTVIQLLIDLNDVEQALQLFANMKSESIAPDARLYDLLMEALNEKGDVKRVAELFEEMQNKGRAFSINAHSYGTMINSYTKAGKLEEGWELFQKMKAEKVPLSPELWNVFLRYISKRGQLDECLLLFNDMNASEVGPNTETYNILLSTTDLPLESKLAVWEQMKTSNVKPDRFTYNLIIGGYLKAKRYSDCEAIFNELLASPVKPDPHLYQTMQRVYVCSGDRSKVLEMRAAAQALVKEHRRYDLHEVVRMKKHMSEEQKRTTLNKDIVQVDKLLSEHTKPTHQPTTDSTSEPEILQEQQPEQVSEPFEQQQQHQHEIATPYPNQYLFQPPYPYSYQQPFPQYQPLYTVPFIPAQPPQHSPSSTSPAPPTQDAGLPRRKRQLNRNSTLQPYTPQHAQFAPQPSFPPWVHAPPWYPPPENHQQYQPTNQNQEQNIHQSTQEDTENAENHRK